MCSRAWFVHGVAARGDDGWFRTDVCFTEGIPIDDESSSPDVSFTEGIPIESFASAPIRCNVKVITTCHCVYEMPILAAEWRPSIRFAGEGKCADCVCRHVKRKKPVDGGGLFCTCGKPSCQPMDTAPAPVAPIEAAAATKAAAAATHAPAEKRSVVEAGLAERPAKRLAETAAAASGAGAAAASSSAPSHSSGARPIGATKSAKRAAAELAAVRTKPPPGWTKVMDFGKLKGYRSRDGRKAMSLPAAWHLYDEQHTEQQSRVATLPSSVSPCTDALPTASRKRPVSTPSADLFATSATAAAPAPATALAAALAADNDDGDSKEEDAPPGLRSPPPGFAFASSPPRAAALAFSKQPALDADVLVGRSILFHWGSIGWQLGTLTRRNFDGRIKRSGVTANFNVHYEVDNDEVATVLSLENYDGHEESSWLLLEQVAKPPAAAATTIESTLEQPAATAADGTDATAGGTAAVPEHVTVAVAHGTTAAAAPAPQADDSAAAVARAAVAAANAAAREVEATAAASLADPGDALPYHGGRTSSRRGKQPLDPAVGKLVWSWRKDLQRTVAGEIVDFQLWQGRVREHFVRYEDGVSLWRSEAEWWEEK